MSSLTELWSATCAPGQVWCVSVMDPSRTSDILALMGLSSCGGASAGSIVPL